MAQQETITLLLDVQVEATKAVQNQQALKQALSGAKAELDSLKKSEGELSEAYIAQEAQVKQLNTQLAANSRVLTAMSQDTGKTAGAYAVLNKEAADAARLAKDMAAAYGVNSKQAMDASASAKTLSDNLKAIDSSVGQNQRRIGDYAGELGKLPGAFGGAAQGASGLKTGFNALSATPLLGIIQILMVVFGALSKAMGGGSDASLKLKQVMAPLTTLFEGFQIILSDVVGWLANGVAVITSFISKALDFIPAVNKMNVATSKTIELERERQKIAEENRNEIVNDAKDEQKIADLKNKIAQKDKYNTTQRLAFAREADKIAKEMMVDDVNRATRVYNNKVKQMQAEGKQYKDLTTEERDALKQAEAEVFRIRTEYSTSTKKLKATEATLVAEIEADKQAKIASGETLSQKRKEEQAKKTEKQLAADKKAEEDRLKQLKDNADTALAALDNELQMAKLKNEERLAGQKLTDEQMQAQKLATIDSTYQAEMAKQNALLANKQITQQQYDDAEALAYQQKLTDKALTDAEYEAIKQENIIVNAANQLQTEMELAELNHQSTLALKQQQLDIDMAQELAAKNLTEEQVYLIQQKYTKLKQDLNQQELDAKLNATKAMLAGVEQIAGEGTFVAKLAASAQTAISTYQAAMGAYANATPLFGPVGGVIAAGIATGAGIASVKKIWATKSGLKNEKGGGGASVPTGAISGGGGMPISSVTGAIVARQSGSTQQASTTTAMTEAMKAAPTQTVLVTNDLTTALDNKVQLKNDNSL